MKFDKPHHLDGSAHHLGSIILHFGGSSHHLGGSAHHLGGTTDLLGGAAAGAELALLVEEADGGVQAGALRGRLQAVVGGEPERHQLGGHLGLRLRLGPAGAEQPAGATLCGGERGVSCRVGEEGRRERHC